MERLSDRQVLCDEIDSGISWMPTVVRRCHPKTIRPTELHRHKGLIEVIYCTRGLCLYESEGKTYQLSPGMCFVSRSSERHRMLTNPQGFSLYSLYIAERMVKRGTFAKEFGWIVRRMKRAPRLFLVGRRVGGGFVKLFNVLSSGKTGEERRIRALSVALPLLVSVTDASATRMFDRRSERVKALADEMREHPERDYPLDSLVTRAAMSPTVLLGDFKAETGYTPHAYLVRCRIELAKRDLRSGKSVSAVADFLGFPSAQHLATQFKRVTGLTPSAWARGS